MKLEGMFATFPLRELIDMIAYSSVTGVLNIYETNQSGHLYFRDGQLYHVDRGEQYGLEALAGLLELPDANFAFVSDIVTDQESLWGNLDYHLQMAERLAVRWRQIRAYVPSMDLVPVLTMSVEAAQRRVGAARSNFIVAVDGVRSLAQIAEELGWAEIDIAEAAAQISLDGVIDFQRPTGRKLSQPAVHPRREEGGLFDRVLTRVSSAPPHPTLADLPSNASREELILYLLRS